MNPIEQMMTMVKAKQNPQQFMLNFLQQQTNPMGQNLLKLAQTQDAQGLEQIARNLCAQRGLDFDTEFANFKKGLGL